MGEEVGRSPFRSGQTRAYEVFLKRSGLKERLLTLGAEIIVERGHSAIGIEGNVCDLVNQEVVAWTLADNPEVVHECLSKLSVLERSLKAGIFRHAG